MRNEKSFPDWGSFSLRERAMGIEPTSTAWKAVIIATIRRPQ